MEGVDAVVHLAALFRTDDEAAIWRANLDGTRNLVAAVQEHAPGARFVMSSTGNVYDADATRPALETDACSPTAAYPASKVAAEQLLRDSGLTWVVLRLPFVYGEGDGHLASLPVLAPRFGLHPAHTYSVAHHRDIAAAVRLALSGVMDGRVVNVTDDAPVTVFEALARSALMRSGWRTASRYPAGPPPDQVNTPASLRATLAGLSDQDRLSTNLGKIAASVGAVEQAAKPIVDSVRTGCPAVPPAEIPPAS